MKGRTIGENGLRKPADSPLVELRSGINRLSGDASLRHKVLDSQTAKFALPDGGLRNFSVFEAAKPGSGRVFSMACGGPKLTFSQTGTGPEAERRFAKLRKSAKSRSSKQIAATGRFAMRLLTELSGRFAKIHDKVGVAPEALRLEQDTVGVAGSSLRAPAGK